MQEIWIVYDSQDREVLEADSLDDAKSRAAKHYEDTIFQDAADNGESVRGYYCDTYTLKQYETDEDGNDIEVQSIAYDVEYDHE